MNPSNATTHPSHRVARQGVAALILATSILLTVGSWTVPATSAEPAHVKAAAIATSAAVTKCPRGTAAGVTSKQITIAATVIDISGGSVNNATYGVPSAADQEANWKLVADNINKAGGIGCRHVVLDLYPVNSFDASAAQQICLNIAASHPFIVLDPGVLTEIGASDCLPAHKVPLASEYLTEEQLDQYHPYYLQIGDLPEDIVYNGILGLKQLGYFKASRGFKKIGVLYHTCSTALQTAESSALKAAAIPSRDIVDYNLGCPTGTDTPASLEQAVLNFKNAGVTDVMMLEITDGGIFTQVAQQQNFKPQYLFAENDAAVDEATGGNAPNPANYNNAVDVLGSAYGEQSTPGYKPSGGTEKCNAIYKAAGQPSVYSQTTGFPGLICDYLWFAQALLSHASTFQASALPRDMRAMGTVDFSYPFAPTNFSAAPADSTYGVDFWRAAIYHASCKCWLIPNATFHPPFK
jgi:hypothetical protein